MIWPLAEGKGRRGRCGDGGLRESVPGLVPNGFLTGRGYTIHHLAERTQGKAVLFEEVEHAILQEDLLGV
jgi:hypothetical protein